MRNDASLLRRGALALMLLVPGGAVAHVTLTVPNAAPGATYMAHFRVGHGCSGMPTIALTVTIPPGVTQVAPIAPPGWTIATVRDDARTTAVTWKGGELAPDKPGEFTVSMMLPRTPGQLTFPATQICKGGEEHWDELPAAGKVPTHPAPLLLVGEAPSTASLVISDAWFRALPAKLPAGGYFTLRNNGAKPVILTGARSVACGGLMLHKSETQGGVAAMDMVAALPVPAGGAISFAPNGYHLMCTDPGPEMRPGASVPVILQFQDGGSLTAMFAVRNAAGK